MLAAALVIYVGCSLTFGLFEMETRYPLMMSLTILLLLGFSLLASLWAAGRVCASSSYLICSNFESTRPRARRRRRQEKGRSPE